MADSINGEAAIIKKEDELPTVDDTSHGKILYVTSETELEGISVTDLLARLSQYANMADALSHVEKTVEYVVQIPIKHQDAFNAGEVFLNQNTKTGVLWPTLYKTMENGKRQFVDNLPIKQEEIWHGNPFESIAVSYHNLYMQRQINELADLVNQTYRVVERIEQGQKDDRIGQLMAGRNQILYAMSLEESERREEVRSGRSKMLVAQEQIFRTFETRVRNFEPIPESSWSRFCTELLHPGSLKRKDAEFDEIQQYYALYLQATQMVAASYALNGELESAEKVFLTAEQNMATVNFDGLKTLQYIHKQNKELFYYHATEYIASEREIGLEEAQGYDTISIQVTGEKLLEAFNYGRQEEVQKPETEQ